MGMKRSKYIITTQSLLIQHNHSTLHEHIKIYFWLKIYGMNSIIAYTLGMVVSFRSIANSLLWGLEKYVGDYYEAILTFANFMILFLILNMMYRMRVFVKI